MFVRLIISALLLFAVCGCTSGSAKKPVNYETIKANPKRDPDAAAKLNKHGVDALSKGKFEKAEKLFKESLIKDVDFGPAHNNLGRLYFDQGQNYLAAWEFEYATKVMPRRSEPYNNLGMVMERVDKLEQAIDAYEMANMLSPHHPEIVGNLARAWWCHDKTNWRTRDLLEQLVFVDCRPDWVSWAKEQIACGKLSGNDILPVAAPSMPPSMIPPQRTPVQNGFPLPYPAPPPIPYPTPLLAPPAPVLPQ